MVRRSAGAWLSAPSRRRPGLLGVASWETPPPLAASTQQAVSSASGSGDDADSPKRSPVSGTWRR